MKSLKNIHFKIKLTLPSAFFLLIMTVATVLITLNQLNYAKSMRSLSSRIMREISTEIQNELKQLKNVSHYQLKQTAILISEHLFSTKLTENRNISPISPLIVHSLKSNPVITQIYFGGVNGNFSNIRQDSLGFLKFRKIGTDSTTFLTLHDSTGKFVREIKTDEYNSYDPRTREWYRSAKLQKTIFSSEVYNFYRTGENGLTYSISVFDEDQLIGVTGLDISMNSLSRFVSKMRINEGGSIFILDKNRKGVVHTIKNGFLKNEKSGHKPTLEVMRKIPNKIKSRGEFIIVKSEGEKHLVLINQFKSGLIMGVIFPMNTILGDVYKSNLIIIIFSLLGVFLASLAGMLISSRVTKPLAELQRQTEEIQKFNLNTTTRISSRFTEIDQIGKSFQRMQKGLASFRKFVPADLVRQIMQSGSEASLGGEKRKMSIMFMDIADFTTLSEQLNSDELVKFISEFFQEMSVIIIKNGGTVDKYIGDCIMAFWNAPSTIKNHEEAATKTALACLSRLEELQVEWQNRGLPQISIRIGVHSDTVTVGNMGSKERLNYTVIGDGVNLTSRLEGLGKVYGVPFIISSSVAKKLPESFIVRSLDKVVVKGKTEPVPIFTVTEVGNLQIASLHKKGYDFYKNQKWEDAKNCFTQILDIEKDDAPANLFLKRINKLKDSLLDDNWNGIFYNLEK